MARVFLDFYKDQGKMVGIEFAFFKCTDHPTYYSLSHVTADKLPGGFISGCQNQGRSFAELYSKGATQI